MQIRGASGSWEHSMLTPGVTSPPLHWDGGGGLAFGAGCCCALLQSERAWVGGSLGDPP